MTRPLLTLLTCLFLTISAKLNAQSANAVKQIYEISGISLEKSSPDFKARLQDNTYILRREYCVEHAVLYVEVEDINASALIEFFHELQLPCTLKKNCDFNRISQVCKLTQVDNKD